MKHAWPEVVHLIREDHRPKSAWKIYGCGLSPPRRFQQPQALAGGRAQPRTCSGRAVGVSAAGHHYWFSGFRLVAGGYICGCNVAFTFTALAASCAFQTRELRTIACFRLGLVLLSVAGCIPLMLDPVSFCHGP
jgi:hypothetical protein